MQFIESNKYHGKRHTAVYSGDYVTGVGFIKQVGSIESGTRGVDGRSTRRRHHVRFPNMSGTNYVKTGTDNQAHSERATPGDPITCKNGPAVCPLAEAPVKSIRTQNSVSEPENHTSTAPHDPN